MNVKASGSSVIESAPGPAGSYQLGWQPLSIASGYISVLSVSPILDDQDALDRLLPPPRWTLYRAQNRKTALAVLQKNRLPIVLCERDLGPETWRDVFEGIALAVDPPLLIVTSRLADEHLWAEALNLGAYDVLAKPFDAMELTRSLTSAWLHWCERHEVARRPKLALAASGW